MSRPRVVVIGGTFDPIHLGHLTMLRCAVDALRAETGVFVVEPGHRHRAVPAAPLAVRRELVRIATVDHIALCEAAELGLPDQLDATVAQLDRGGHEVHVVFGADSARHLSRWNGVDRLNRARLWVVARSGDHGTDIDNVTPLPIEVPEISASLVRRLAASGLPLVGAVGDGMQRAIEQSYGGRLACAGRSEDQRCALV